MGAAAPLLSNPFSTGFQRVSTLLLWLLRGLLLFQARVDAQNPRADVQTLLKFKAMVEVDSPAVTRGFLETWRESDETPCTWDGIICTSSSTVEVINLSAGPPPSQGWNLEVLPSLGVLSNLTDLRQLDLSENPFKNLTSGGLASIPEDIGSLVGLTHLDLSYSSFTGPIPKTLSNCKNLRQIFLGLNELNGEIPDLSGLENLQYLQLSVNNLSGPIPTWLGKLNSLQRLDLSNNSFSGTIPSLPNLTNLLEVSFNNNNLTGFEGALFPDSKRLERLWISGNQLAGPIPPSITSLLNLKTLDLSSNNLSGPVPSDFSLNMSDEIWIDLSYNQLTGNIPENLLQPTPAAENLPGVKMSNNRLTGNIPLDGSKEYNYWFIDFSYNNLSGPINFSSICSNGGTLINSLYLQNNSLSGDIVDFLAQCHGYVGDMRLANNSFSGDLSRMVNISNPGASTRACFPQGNPFCVLDLSNNDLQMSTTEAYPDPLRAVLERLVLNTSLTRFSISGNNFPRARLPSYFTLSAESLQVLDLSGNHLNGEISSEAFNSTWLPALEIFNLSNNAITGPISEALVIIPSLTLLDVANNRLSGPLPSQLPNGLYNPSFFAGNVGLCGGPLRSCSQGGGVQWWVLLLAVGGSMIIGLGSCLAVTWRLKVYREMHQQDTDLIKTLLERESASLMSLRDLTKATNNFAESSQIGAGGFGVVYAGKLKDGTMVAIKRSKHEGSEENKNRFLNEVRILSQVNHRHLVKLLGCCMENKATLLVFEFVSNGTLQEHLQRKIGLPHGLTWKQRLRIAIQTADALNYLHSATTYPIYHRDVKSANILLDDDLNAKVADFGISRLAPLQVTHVSTVKVQGTIGYIDPEYYTSYQLTDKSDVFSFGVVLLELISAKPAIDFGRGGDETGLVNFANVYIESGDLQPLIDVALMETYNDSATNGGESILSLGRLAMKCLHLRSKARPGMHEVWKELQNIWHEFQGTSKDLGSSVEPEDSKAPIEAGKHDIDNIVLLSDSFSCSSSRFDLPLDSNTIEMSQFSEFARVR